MYGLLGGKVPLISQGTIHSRTLIALTVIAVVIGVVAAIVVRAEMLSWILRPLIGSGSAGGADLYWRLLTDKTPTWVLVYLKRQDCVLLGAPEYLDMGAENRALFLAKVRKLDAELRDTGLVQGPGVIVPLDEISMIEIYKS